MTVLHRFLATESTDKAIVGVDLRVYQGMKSNGMWRYESVTVSMFRAIARKCSRKGGFRDYRANRKGKRDWPEFEGFSEDWPLFKEIFLATKTDCEYHLSNSTLMEDLLVKLPMQKRIEWAQHSSRILPRPT
ncbi:unnamed protein product [Ceratitis capitata]|uniref:(Mediterranean fruit fly) hypothetical protein n=1 Tax=Ceratitis capitata TaxID=7213 RepID=A0A811UVJ2_CERCA|nr:unnamed protein product [Ceratitis capitata]